MLANASNLAWFGNTEAVPQHQQISRMRTLELQRPMLRATNTGATAVIDHTGLVTDHLPAFTRGQLPGVVQARYGLTPFARWAGPWGLWPLWVLGLLLLLNRRWGPPAQALRRAAADRLRDLRTPMVGLPCARIGGTDHAP